MSTVTENSNRPDAQLVAASLAGERDAFAAIVRRYQGVVTGVIYNRCHGNLARSEELAQDTFVTAWQKLPTLKSTERLGSWLCGIARNLANSANRRERQTEVTTDALAIAEAQQDDPTEAAISKEQEQIVWRSLEQIPETYREPMILFYRQEQSVADVASALELNEATVRKRLERGRAMLKEQVAALVEETLSDTAPSPGFSLAVLAALPAIGTKAATATGGGTLLGVSGAKPLGLLAFWLGPLLGIFGGVYGVVAGIRASHTPREKRFVIHKGIVIALTVITFIGLNFGLVEFRGSMTGEQFVRFNAVMWIVFALVISAMAYYFNRRQRTIQIEEGTQNHPPRIESPWSNALHVKLSLGAGLFGGTAFLLAMAYYSADWLSLGVILAVDIGMFVWSTRTIQRDGPTAARRVMLTTMSVLWGVVALVVNLRFNDWLAGGAGAMLDLPTGAAAPQVSMLDSNLLLLGIGIMMILPIVFSKEPSEASHSN